MLYLARGARRMKITVLHHGFQVAGGGEKVTLSLLRALDRTSHDVALRCVHPPAGFLFCGEEVARRTGRDGGAAGDGRREEKDGEPTHEFRRVRLSLVPPGGGAGGGPRAPDMRAEFASLFVGTDCDLLVVTDGGFAMEKTDAPRVILYANSDLSASSLALSPSIFRRPFRTIRLLRGQTAIRRKLSMIRAERAVVVVPNSESTARVFARRVGPSSLGRVVYPPVDLGRFERLRGAPRERRVATTGRFSPEKNHEAAVRVMRAVGARWDAVGNARGDYQERYLQRLKGMAGPDMHFHVDAGESELDGVLGGARAYLHPRRESFGIAVVEAIAAGCVPVVPDNSAHPETVPDKDLRYSTEKEAVEVVRGALDGRYDGLLQGLYDRAQTFSEDSFQKGMLDAIDRHGP